MKKIINYLAVSALFSFPFISNAQLATAGNGGQFEVLLGNILIFANDVLIPFILGIGFLFFVWGMFQFFIFGGANDESKEKGKSLLIHATLGFVMIIIFWGVVNMVSSSTGLSNQSILSVPQANLIPTT